MRLCVYLILLPFAALVFSGGARAQQSELDSLSILTASSDEISDDMGAAHSRLAWLKIIQNPEEAERHIDTALHIFESIDNVSGVLNSHYRYAVLYRVTSRYEESHREIDIYLNHPTTQEDTLRKVNGLYQKGVLYSLEGNYEASLEVYLEILSGYTALQDSTAMGFTLNSIGVVQKNLGLYEEARESYIQAQEIHTRLGNKNDLADALMNLGGLSGNELNFEEAISYYEQANALNEETGNVWGKSVGMQNVGSTYINLGLYDEAISILKNSLEIQSENNFSLEQVQSMVYLARAYRENGDLSASMRVLNEAAEIDVNSLKVQNELQLEFAMTYEELGNLKKALDHYAMHHQLKDSLVNEQTVNNLNSLMVQYETEKKDLELKENALEIEQQNAALLRSAIQTNWAIFVGVVLFVLGIGGFIYFNQRQKIQRQQIENLTRTQQIKNLESFIEGEEKERQRVAQDLHDGLNGDLSFIKYSASSLLSSSNDQEKAQEVIEQIDKACSQVRAISHNLAPMALTGANLEQSLLRYCQRMSEAHHLQINLEFFGDTLQLDTMKSTVVYRMIQEMIQNTVKHAKASEVMVQFNNHGPLLNITVEDNGSGFDTQTASAGLGIQSIVSRVEMLGGEVDLQSGQEGTSYHIELSTHNNA